MVKPISEHDRWAIVHHLREGSSIRATAKRLKLPHSTVHKWWQRFKSTDNVQPLPKAGRKRIFDEIAEQRAFELLTSMDTSNAHSVGSQLKVEGFIANLVHRTTVVRAARRAAQHSGEKLWCQRGKPPKAMTEATKQKRLQFAKANLGREWAHVLFTDRKKFHFRYPGSRVQPYRWVKGRASSTNMAVHQPNHAQTLNLYAGISKYGVTAAHVVTGSSKHTSAYTNKQGKVAKNITTSEYKEVINKTFLPQGSRLFSTQGISTWTLQQDNDPTHKCAGDLVAAWNTSKGSSVKLMSPWPPNSPDLNLIENVWAWVQVKVDSMGCSNFEEFKQAVISTLAAVPKEHLTRLYASMGKRLAEVVENGGGPPSTRWHLACTGRCVITRTVSPQCHVLSTNHSTRAHGIPHSTLYGVHAHCVGSVQLLPHECWCDCKHQVLGGWQCQQVTTYLVCIMHNGHHELGFS